MNPLILISNDDGYLSNGLKVLINVARQLGDVFVVAPDRARSGASCSVTSDIPVSYTAIRQEDGLQLYSCTGTPADCVKLALDQMLLRRPDLVLSGINHGSNASVNVHYSGTTAAATEAALHGIPAVAFSSLNPNPAADLSPLAPICTHISELVLHNDLPYGSFLNVNFPDTDNFRGIRVCRMAYSRWVDEFEPCERGRGGHYFWLSGEQVDDEPNSSDTDLWALNHDYVAITPTSIDPTHRALMSAMQDWDL